MANIYQWLIILTASTNQVCSVEWVPGQSSVHERHRRSVGAAPSPTDRPSCKPGAATPVTQVDTTTRLQSLRQKMVDEGIQGYIIPSEDQHQSEFSSDYDLRRGFISGFSGSAGIAVVLVNKAALWTDGRYYLEAENALDCNWILMKDGLEGVPTITDWIKSEVTANQKVGASAFLMSSSKWKSYETELQRSSIVLYQITGTELIDQIWTAGRPQQPDTTINALPMQYAGRSWQDKISDTHKRMEEKGTSALIITGLDETAWLFNLRAKDVPYNPFFLSYAVVERNNNTRLYIKSHARKLTENPSDNVTTINLQTHLNTKQDGSCNGKTGFCVQVLEYSPTAVLSYIRSLTGTVWVAYNCNFAIYSAINENNVYQANTPVAVQKSQKNDVEIQGMKNSHIRDAVAVIRFAAKMEKEVREGKEWTEVSAAGVLDSYRRILDHNRGLSFNTISASGSNGAVIHYHPDEVTNKRLTTSDMYLVDSGGQYLDGTTDVTRTFHFGTPTDFEKECYTRVLMGQIDLALAIYQKGVYGREIDAFARKHLWDVGLVYHHGTGHGIGAYLSVHEGPGRISLAHKISDQDIPLMAHQFYSDEPGYYQDGKFGIRLETIVMIKKVDTKYQFPDTEFLGFEYITLVPYEPHLIDYNLLSKKQVEWLNTYHRKCLDAVGPILKATGDTLAYGWFEERTKANTGSTSGVASPTTGVLTLFVILLCPILIFS